MTNLPDLITFFVISVFGQQLRRIRELLRFWENGAERFMIGQQLELVEGLRGPELSGSTTDLPTKIK